MRFISVLLWSAIILSDYWNDLVAQVRACVIHYNSSDLIQIEIREEYYISSELKHGNLFIIVF